jgi:hypothetical protein
MNRSASGAALDIGNKLPAAREAYHEPQRQERGALAKGRGGQVQRRVGQL